MKNFIVPLACVAIGLAMIFGGLYFREVNNLISIAGSVIAGLGIGYLLKAAYNTRAAARK